MKGADILMEKGLDQRKRSIALFIGFLLFIMVHCLCLIKTLDDLMWDNIDSLSQMLRSCNPNGRYFTNILTYFICNSSVLCFFVYTLFMGLFVYLISDIFKPDLRTKWVSFLFAGLVFLLSPRYFFVHIFNWISGFTNYVISLVFALVYLRYCFPIFEKKSPDRKKIFPFLFLIVGFFGALCIENITVYNILLGIFVIVFALVTQKRVYLSNIAYFLGTLIGSFVMMSDSNYQKIAEQGDDIAFRSFVFSLPDIYMKIFREIIANYARPYFLLHFIICGCILWLYVRKFGNSEKKPKYAAVSISVIILYSVLSFITSNGDDIAVLTNSYRSRAIETALTFAYIIALLYMVFCLFEGGKRVKAFIYLLSTIAVTAPFIVVNSITGRCFFASFIFWCLFTFQLLVPVVNSAKMFELKLTANCAAAVLIGTFGINLFMDITNKYVDIVRIDYIHQQLEADERQIKLIKLPYQKNCFDPIEHLTENELFLNKDGTSYSYTELYCINNRIDEKIFEKQLLYIDMIDYNMSREEY